MNSIESIFSESKYFHDRFFNESFELPYDFDDIKIQPNDLATCRSFNLSIDKLYDNFLYIYSLTKMGSNVVPESLEGYAGVSAVNTGIGWKNQETTFVNFNSTNLGYFDIAVYMSVAQSEVLNQNLIVTSSLSSVTISKTPEDRSSFTVILSSNRSNLESDLLYKNITSATIKDEYLYVVDSYYNNIYRYNLQGFLSDVVIEADLIIDKQIGGRGDFLSNFKFNQVKGISILNDLIYVNDSGNFCVKVYDLDFNFIKMRHLKNYFEGDKCIEIATDAFTDRIMCLTEGYNLYVFDLEFNLVTSVALKNVFADDEVFKNIFVAKSFENTYYVVTNLNVYKFYFSKPNNLIGKFSLYRLGVDTDTVFIYGESVSTLDGTSDTIYLLTELEGVRRFIQVTDNANFEDVLTQSDFDIYTLSDIHINQNEYSQTFVYAKSISKLILNHARLKDKMIGRFYGTHDTQKNLLLTGFFYFTLDDLDLTAYEIGLDHFPGNNEIFMSAVLNRGLKRVFDIQTAMINKSNTLVVNSTYFDDATVVVP